MKNTLAACLDVLARDDDDYYYDYDDNDSIYDNPQAVCQKHAQMISERINSLEL